MFTLYLYRRLIFDPSRHKNIFKINLGFFTFLRCKQNHSSLNLYYIHQYIYWHFVTFCDVLWPWWFARVNNFKGSNTFQPKFSKYKAAFHQSNNRWQNPKTIIWTKMISSGFNRSNLDLARLCDRWPRLLVTTQQSVTWQEQ